MKEYKLMDTYDDRNYHFTGRVLGHASSERHWKDMWTEFTIYVTQGGTYVVAREGVPRDGDVVRAVFTAGTPRDLVSAMYSRKRQPDGSKSQPMLSSVAKDCIEEAAEKDDGIYDVYYEPRIA